MNELRAWHARLVQAVGEEAAVAIEVTICLLVLLTFFWIRWQFGSFARAQRARRRRFRSLARAQGLARSDRALLAQMAESLKLEESSTLFVKRSLFEKAGVKLAVDRARLEELRRRLYS